MFSFLVFSLTSGLCFFEGASMFVQTCATVVVYITIIVCVL